MNSKQTSGPVLERQGDLAAMLTNLRAERRLVHRRDSPAESVVEEILYPALEDYQIDIMIGEGPAARSVKLDLPPFTLVGATTRAGMLTNPLRDRFGIVARLEFIRRRNWPTIVARSASLLNVATDSEGAQENRQPFARHTAHCQPLARGVCAISRKSNTRAVSHATSPMRPENARRGQDRFGHDGSQDALVHHRKFSGGPVGVENLAAALSEERDTIEGRTGAISHSARLSAARRAWPRCHGAGLSAFRPHFARPRRHGGVVLMAKLSFAVRNNPALHVRLPHARVLRGHRCGRGGVSRAVREISRACTHRVAALSGFTNSDLEKKHKLVFIVSELHIEYLKPALLDDALNVTVGIESVGRVRIVFARKCGAGMKRW